MHGLDRYRSKTDPCRCDVCRAAKADYERGRRADRATAERKARARGEWLTRVTKPREPIGPIEPSATGLPCRGSSAFISDSVGTQRRAAALCLSCPMFEACWELGRGEEAGVYAGTIPCDPERKSFRKAVRKLGWESCANGHPTEEYGELLVGVHPDSYYGNPYGCRRCTELRNAIDRANSTEESAA